MACVRLGEVLSNAMGNIAAGRAWFARARRLLVDEPPCIEQGWVAVAAMGCDVDDPAALLADAELALDRARRFGDVNLETKALADAGLAHVQAGRVVEGMAMLDEAMALACGPADNGGVAAKSACSFFTACYVSGDFERVGSWTDLLTQTGVMSGSAPEGVFLSSHCDSVRAALLVEMGRWGEAEAMLVAARTNFERMFQAPSWHPDIGLAELRIRQGRLAEAEQLLIGKDQSISALVPSAQLHLARGDHALARAAAQRGLRAIHDDRLRAIELLVVLVEAELAAGDLEAAGAACAALADRTRSLGVATLRARSSRAQAHTVAARGDLPGAIAVLESTVDEIDPSRLAWLHASLLIDLARLRELAGDRAGAHIDAQAAAAALARLDVVVDADSAQLVDRLTRHPSATRDAEGVAVLMRDGKWWVADHEGTRLRLQDSKGLAYVADLIANAGIERHVLDLVDRVEGVDSDAPDRRSLGDAGELLDSQARTAYRRRIEALRAEAGEALEAGMLERAEAAQDELDQLVAQLAAAFGLGGRNRRAASAAERSRLNVTRAVRAAISRLEEGLPEAGAALDRRVRTGMYCTYTAVDGELRWIVQS